MPDGSRKVTSIAEVQRMEGDVITMQELFAYKVESITGAKSVVGELRPTGLRPTFNEKLDRKGIKLSIASPNGHSGVRPDGDAVRGIRR